jgi:2-amino-4-hydroxy-6-hydroxymethyldihydropteridine diphosphokinase
MILVALGSNVPGPWGNPRRMIAEALRQLDRGPLRLVRASTVIDTEPFGNVDQPRFVNAVAIVITALQPSQLMEHLHDIERRGGRQRGERWGPRSIDLDIIDYHGRIVTTETLQLPHAGLAQRSFVLLPIIEIAPSWRHPENHQTARQLLDLLWKKNSLTNEK